MGLGTSNISIMANLNIGDKVRFLNAVGGGIVRRMEGEMAYVEEPDGFETPILMRECVVVEPALPRTTRKAVQEKAPSITAYVVKEDGLVPFTLTLGDLTDEERQIILDGCLINYNRVG